MKILAISCSPRPKGSTMTLLGHALKGAQQEGAETELFSVAGKNINPCQG
jgi:multimeric flavodoxin WrbA